MNPTDLSNKIDFILELLGGEELGFQQPPYTYNGVRERIDALRLVAKAQQFNRDCLRTEYNVEKAWCTHYRQKYEQVNEELKKIQTDIAYLIDQDQQTRKSSQHTRIQR